jgi:hypothetical protein
MRFAVHAKVVAQGTVGWEAISRNGGYRKGAWIKLRTWKKVKDSRLVILLFAQHLAIDLVVAPSAPTMSLRSRTSPCYVPLCKPSMQDPRPTIRLVHPGVRRSIWGEKVEVTEKDPNTVPASKKRKGPEHVTCTHPGNAETGA